MDEFSLIDALLEALGDVAGGPGVTLGPGDDCAITGAPRDAELASTIDSLVCGRHFPQDAAAQLVGSRAIGVAVSDLAAMGAEPAFCIVALTLPEGDEVWVRGFARGIADAARRIRCAVVGGNLARGPLNIAVSAHGWVPAGRALRRSGAHPGDVVGLTGELGGAVRALEHPRLLTVREPGELAGITPDHPDYPLRRYYVPAPRVNVGVALRGVATAAIDVSDGLLADAGHLCTASRVAMRIDGERVPIAPGTGFERAVTGGDDYELCFTLPAAAWPGLEQWATAAGERVSRIGEVVEGSGVQLAGSFDAAALRRAGYQHFGQHIDRGA